MTCQECEELLHPYLDGEMDAPQRAAVDAHLKDCKDCRQALEHLQMLRRALQLPELRYPASETLRHRLQEQLREADAHERRRHWPRWATAAAAAAIVVSLVLNFMPHHRTAPVASDDEDAMVDSAVDQQQDAVKKGHLMDLTTSDPRAVQSWFSGKLAYQPPVPDLSAEGYALVGARLDKVKDEPAAALVYQHGSDVVTVFVCAADKPGDKAIDTDSDDGYQVVYWTQGSLSFWMVSKLDAAQLKRIGESLQHVG
ncbi:MAG TPA: anti-sigma factor [Gammaproteobacteria bacterium]